MEYKNNLSDFNAKLEDFSKKQRLHLKEIETEHRARLKEIQQDSEKRFKQIQDDFDKKFRELDEGLASSRTISRDIVHKIILLSTGIIGFSVTLASVPFLSGNIDIPRLTQSWTVFLLTIVFGYLPLILESRINYCLKWRGFQVQDYELKISTWNKVYALLIAIYSILFPRNLIFCRIYKNEADTKLNAARNAHVVMTLANLEKLTFIFENIFVVLFVTGLYLFVRSFSQ